MNEKLIKFIQEKLEEYEIDYEAIGSISDRYSFKVNNFICKVALNDIGKNKNMMEYAFFPELQPFAIKCYGCYEDGLVALFECPEGFNDDTQELFGKISDSFLRDLNNFLDDYSNWGFRDDNSLVILDFDNKEERK